MKSFYKISVIAMMIMICTMSVKAQTAHFCLDTLQNSKIKYCLSDYNEVWLYKPTAAQTSIEWQIQNPGLHSIYADSILVTSTNTGQMSFYSTETGWFNFNFYLVNGPANPNLPDITTCGNIFSYVVNSGSSGINATWLWNSGTTTRRDTITTEGTKWVVIDNGCGPIVTDTFEVISNHTNDAHLGSDLVTCLHDTITLNTGNTNIVSYTWSTGANSSTIDIYTSGIYVVTTTDNSNCVSADSMELTVLLPPDINICYVEFDTITLKNRIVWATPPANASNIKIYNEISAGVFSLIGTVPNSQTSYIDMNSNPQSMSYSYKIAVVDTCGNESNKSAFHKTITLLSTYDQLSNTYGFTWSAYEGLTVANYYLYGLTASNQAMQIGSVPGNSYFYNYANPSPLFIKYFVAFFTPSCSNKTDHLVKSNIVASVTTGIDENISESISIFPNPTHDRIFIQTPETSFETEIINVFGQVVLKHKNKHEIDVSTLSTGTYFIRLTGDSFTVQKSFVVY